MSSNRIVHILLFSLILLTLVFVVIHHTKIKKLENIWESNE